jgi:hypothetical protein
MSALRLLVCSRVQQFLRRRFYENDPASAKAYRYIRSAVAHHPRLSLQKFLCGATVIFDLDAGEVHRPPFTLLEALSANCFTANMTVDQLVDALFANAQQILGSAIAIDLSDLFVLIKRFLATPTPPEAHAPDPLFISKQQALFAASQAILDELNSTILAKYIRNGKLAHKHALAMFSALKDLLSDLLRKQEAEDHYHYLQRYWPELSHDDYMRETRKIFEYLVRLAMEKIRQKYKEIF